MGAEEFRLSLAEGGRSPFRMRVMKAAIRGRTGRALLSDLHANMSEEQFDEALAATIDEIYRASTHQAAS